MSEKILNDHKKTWEQKAVLKHIYHDFYNRIISFAVKGKTLEIGGGTGNLKEYLPSVTTTDIVPSPWLDFVCDAQDLPFDDESFDNIVGVDVLHHIERPILFFKEAVRVLKKSGRIILIDPAITKMSYGFYHFIHEEPVDLKADPLEDGPLSQDRKPFDANQAIPTLLYKKYKQDFEQKFPEFEFKTISYFSLWAYPLSGGFKPWSLIPSFLTPFLLKLEQKLEPYIGKFLAFRVIAVIEKK
jgi:SAM-dependent methyltransferase